MSSKDKTKEEKSSSKDKAKKDKSSKKAKQGDTNVPTDEMSKLKVKDKDDKKSASSTTNKGRDSSDSGSDSDSDHTPTGTIHAAPLATAPAASTGGAAATSTASGAAATSTSGAGGQAATGGAAGGAAGAAAGGAGGSPGGSGAGIQHGVDKDTIIQANNVSYRPLQVVGTGSFGVVMQALVIETQELVAIKKVLQDKRFKNRELQIMRLLNHPNVVQLKSSFYTSGSKPNDDVYLNLVQEYVPETVYRVARQYTKQKQHMPVQYIKVYMYQLLKALEYIHGLGICHRDIKPQNLLLDTANSILKLCDFGSAKILVKGEPNVAYICSRYYRAPELIFGATAYTTAIDIWSTGCVMAELILGAPMFPGASGMDQLVEIIKVLGTPTKEQIKLMNPKYTEFRFPQIKAHPWSRVFRNAEADTIDLVAQLLVYDPTTRKTATEALRHAFFDQLRQAGFILPNGKPLPKLEGIN